MGSGARLREHMIRTGYSDGLGGPRREIMGKLGKLQ